MTINEILKLYEEKKWRIDDFNFFVIRTNRVFTNKFSDIFYWFYKDETNKNKWIVKWAKGTSKAGLYYVEHFLNEKGTGIVKEGQHLDSHKLGFHQGKYEAFVQNKSLPVWRDDDKDDWIDFREDETGFFGINIHRANAKMESTIVDKWSAACLVFANPLSFNTFLNQFKKSGQKTLSLTIFTPTNKK